MCRNAKIDKENAEIREQAGLLPHTEGGFGFDGEVVRIVRAKAGGRGLASSPVCGAAAMSR
jgi:hypothetical protein